jgi:malate dehydrogenase (oxaloacetate-decarboxylating)
MTVETLEDLSIAYTPGVASVCMAIHEDRSESFHLTNRGNMVAVVTDGSAVLGLGNIGPEAAMPVMEGKSILFKGLADVDAFPICLAFQDNDSIIQTVRSIAPSFGGINLEDIAAPRCFEIEDALQDLGIPVFHDDQHGTAIAVLAAVINSLGVTNRRIEETKFVFAGAGAGGIASAKLLMDFGAKNITLVDSTGIIHKGRTNLTPVKTAMLETTNPDNIEGGLADALRGADVFIGLSAADTVSSQMVSTMAKDSIVFAMANPVPEIMPNLAREAGAAVVGTGRSDFPNQINNSLVFPGVFRGALDVHATRITTKMKLAAAQALAALVKEPTTENVIPWSLDKEVAKAVAKATADSWG